MKLENRWCQYNGRAELEQVNDATLSNHPQNPQSSPKYFHQIIQKSTPHTPNLKKQNKLQRLTDSSQTQRESATPVSSKYLSESSSQVYSGGTAYIATLHRAGVRLRMGKS